MHDNPQLPWYSIFWSRKRKAAWIAERAAEFATRKADMKRVLDAQAAQYRRITEDIAVRASERALTFPNTPRRPWTPVSPLPPMPTQTTRTPANRPNPPASPSAYTRTRRDDDDSSMMTNIVVATAVGSAFSGGSRETVSYDNGPSYSGSSYSGSSYNGSSSDSGSASFD